METPTLSHDTSSREVYLQLLGSISEKAQGLGDPVLCLFATVRGKHWNHDLLVYGRAVNGLDERQRWKPSCLADERCRHSVYEKAISAARSSGECPLRWVVDWWGQQVEYNTKRSAFWRTIRDVLARLVPTVPQDEWSSYLAWGNLYRIAPGHAGNPSERLYSLQQAQCRKLLALDLKELKPRRLLLLTGWNWAAPLVGPMNLTPVSDAYVEAIGTQTLSDGGQVNVVVAKHPQGKPHRPFVDAVVNAFGTLASELSTVS